jgi:hypothetical protein
MCTEPDAQTIGKTRTDEDAVISFMRDMREQFGTFEFRAVSPGGTILCSKNWHRVPSASKELPLFLRDKTVGGRK